MSITQVVAMGIVGAALSVTLRKASPETALFIGITTGALIVLGVLGQLAAVLDLLNDMTGSASINSAYVTVIMKVIGIAYIAEFGAQTCKDAQEGSIASKIELAGKILIMSVAAPVVLDVLGTVTALLP